MCYKDHPANKKQTFAGGNERDPTLEECHSRRMGSRGMGSLTGTARGLTSTQAHTSAQHMHVSDGCILCFILLHRRNIAIDHARILPKCLGPGHMVAKCDFARVKVFSISEGMYGAPRY